MNKDEMKNKYSAFITEISEILGLGKPVDILKLCTTTDLFFRPLQNQIKELESQIEKMKNCRNCKNEKIEGACGHFTQVGWCKNWELAD